MFFIYIFFELCYHKRYMIFILSFIISHLFYYKKKELKKIYTIVSLFIYLVFMNINNYLLELKDFINLSSSFFICLISLSFRTLALILIVYVPPPAPEADANF